MEFVGVVLLDVDEDDVDGEERTGAMVLEKPAGTYGRYYGGYGRIGEKKTKALSLGGGQASSGCCSCCC